MLGRTIRYARVSDEDFQAKLLEVGFPDEDASALADAYRYIRTCAGSTVTTSVADLTGRAPVTFAEFCREHAPTLTP